MQMTSKLCVYLLCSLIFINLAVCNPPLPGTSQPSASQLLDFERDMLDSFVLETKKIDIPGYPDAFNPSIIRWQDSFLLSFRTSDTATASSDENFLLSFRTRDPLNRSTNGVGLVFLDKEFNLIGHPQILDIHYLDPRIAPRQQDPRLLSVGNKLFIVYSNIIEGTSSLEVRRMFVAELQYDGVKFHVCNPECITQFEGEYEQRWQKNWVPFEFDGELLLSYSITPHKVLKPRLGTGSPYTSASTHSVTKSLPDWKWGVLRGGTPALLVDGEYLSFFHSSIDMPSEHSNGKKITHYFMGAYTFSAQPPFEIKKISSKPIVGPSFYHGAEHKTWKPLRVVFPCGFVFNESTIWVAYGRQDHEIWIAKIDKRQLIQSLVTL